LAGPERPPKVSSKARGGQALATARQLAARRSTGCPVTAAISSKSLSRWRTVS
jgi:hypothetical protein